jgi:hypothetical protein
MKNHMKKLKIIQFVLLTSIFFQTLSFAESKLGGLPTFTEFHYLEILDQDSQEWEDLDRSIKRRLEISKQQIKNLLETNIPKNILFAAVQQEDYNLYKKALQTDNSDPLVLASTVILCFREERFEYRGLPSFCKNSKELIHSLRFADPKNSLPWYQLAALENKEGNILKATQYLKQGNALPAYESYVVPLFLVLRNTYKELGYPPFLSNMLAFDKMLTNLDFMLVQEMCANEDASSFPEDFLKECFLLGKKIEKNSKTMLEQLVAIYIQRKVTNSERIKGLGLSIEEYERKRELISQPMRTNSLFENLNEDQWVEFYDDFANYGEVKAAVLQMERYGK